MAPHWDEPRAALWEHQEDPDERWSRKLQQARLSSPNGIKLGQNLATRLPIYLAPDDLSTHLQVVGATGLGKSFFLENIIKRLILLGHGACVVDPHGDLYHRLLDWLAYVHRQRPELHIERRVIPADIADTKNILAFNPVARNARVMTYQVVALMEAIRKCWGQATFQETPRLARWLFNTGYAVVDTQTTMLQTRDMVDPKPNFVREALAARITDPRIRGEWEWLSSAKDDKREERVESCFNRIRLFVGHELIRLIVGQHLKTINFPAVLADRKILLVNLARQNTISEDDQHLLGTLFVNELLTAAFARPREHRAPFFLCIDEFQNFVTKDACAILDGGRKFGLHLILAHQFLQQLKQKDPEVYYSTLTNARVKVVFGGLPEEDLDLMARELYTGELDPDEVKDEIWQTKFRPVETTRVVYTDSWGSSSGTVTHESLMSGTHYIPGSDFWSAGTYTTSSASTSGRGSQSGSYDASSRSEVPFYEFHEFRELSSRTFRQLEEQLYIRKSQLKRQANQHAAVLIPDKRTQLIKAATLKDFSVLVKARHREEFIQACQESAGCFKSRDEASREIAALEEKLLSEGRGSIQVSAPPKEKPKRRSRSDKTVFDPLLKKNP